MKKLKLLLVLVVVLALVPLAFAACEEEHTHAFGNEYTIVTAPTATAQGSATHACACGETETVAIPALSDTSVWTAVANPGATHIADGTMSYFSIYGKVDVAVAKTGDHTFDQHIASDAFKKSDATCAAKAVYYVSCVCGVAGTETFEYGETLAHTYKTQVLAEPTCTSAGSAKSVCSVCGDTLTTAIPALGHSWGTTATELESDSAYHVYSCTRCGEVNSANMEAHTYGEDYLVPVAASGSTLMYAYHDCKICGHTEETESISGTLETDWAHVEDKDVAPTYFQDGSKTFTKGSYTYVKVIDKLVAPYENKTYSVVEVSSKDYEEAAREAYVYNWSANRGYISLGKNGSAVSSVAPFSGTIAFSSYNDETGAVAFTVESGDAKKTYTGVVNDDGIMAVLSEDATCYLLIPSQDVSESDFEASYWTIGASEVFAVSAHLNCDYIEGHDVNIFVNGTNAYIGVSFKDVNGAEVSASACYNNTNGVIVDDIAAFVYNGQTLVVSDGLHGSYKFYGEGNEVGTIVLSGEGHYVLTYEDEDDGLCTENGIYEKTAKEDEIDIYGIADGKKVAYVLGQIDGNKIDSKSVEVTLTYNYGTYSATATATSTTEVSVKIPLSNFVKPSSNNDEYVFAGWYLDEDCTQSAIGYEPTADFNLYARWAKEVTANISDMADTTKTSVSLVMNEKTLNSLTSYTENEIKEIGGVSYYFAGWTLKTSDDEEDIEDTTVNAVSMEGATIVANWKVVPVYYGSYNGNEVWSESSGNNSSNYKSLKIDVLGNITGGFTGKVVSYDETTQELVFYKGTSTSTTYKMYLDSVNGIIATHYSWEGDIDTDINIVTVGQAEKSTFEKAYGLYVLNPFSEKESYGYYLHVVTLNSRTGKTNAAFYNNKIYGNVTLTDASGNALAVSEISSAKSLVIKDAVSGDIILAIGAADGKTIGTSTSTSAHCQFLDAYFGTYTLTDGTIVFDGLGNFVWGSKSGTYTKTESGFDLFVVKDGVNTEYHTMTVAEGNNATITAQTVKLTLNVPADESKNSTITAYLKVATALPVDISVDGKIFRGWYKESTFTTAIDNNSIVATESTTLYAKYLDKVTVTLHFNDGTTKDATKEIAKDETLTLDTPIYTKHSFVAWHTDSALASEAWISGTTVVSANIDLYAEWEDCAYAQSYTFAYVSGYRNSNSSSSSYISTKTASDGLSFVGTGIGTLVKGKEGILPFDGCTSQNSSGSSYDDDYSGYGSSSSSKTYLGYDISIKSYDKTTGLVTFAVIKYGKSSNSTYTYYGYLDSATGIIVADYTKDSKKFEKVAVFLPDGYAISGTYATLWGKQATADGYSMFIDYTDSASATHTIFVDNGTIYFDATVVDKANAHISAGSVYSSKYVKISNGSTDLYTVGYNGKTLVAFDGYEGTYTATGDIASLSLDGLGTITIGDDSASYTLDTTNNKIVVTVGGVYYEITNIDKAAHTCTVSAPKATVNYVLEHASLTGGTAQQVGIKVDYTLPTPTCDAGYQFVGWYKEATFTNKVTSVTLNTTDAVTYYAKIETVPAWADKATAASVNYSDNVEISGETNELNQTYYAKLVITEAGNYYFYSDAITLKGGNGGRYYGRYSVLDGDGNAVTNGKSVSFDGYTKAVALTVGTYYVEVHLGGKVTGSSYNYTGWGTFAIKVVKADHDTADTAIAYTLGTEATVVEPSGNNKINTVYAVQLEAGKTYRLTNGATSYAPIYLYSTTSLTGSQKFTVGSSTSYNVPYGSEGTVTITTSGTYYIVTCYSLTFTMVEVTE